MFCSGGWDVGSRRLQVNDQEADHSQGGRVARFEASLDCEVPPPSFTLALQALWWASKGDWERAHSFVQGEPGPDAAWVHAHLHRIEGDLANAQSLIAGTLLADV
jgi:hypothetical protein